jgi:hypothetical protein
MAFSLFKILKGILLKNDADETKQIEVSVSNSATTGTKTTIQAAQTANRSINIPDADDTLVGKATTDTFTNKTFDADGTGNSISNIEDADIKAGANIARNKLASGTADYVAINSGTGVFSEEQYLAKSRGGAGADQSSVTYPSSGTITTDDSSTTLQNKKLEDSTTQFVDNADATKELDVELGGAGTGTKTTIVASQTGNRSVTLPDATDTLMGKATTDTMTNKTFDADGTGNSITNIEDADIKAGADIARSKTAAGTADYVMINDGAGEMSEEQYLAKTRGGTGITSSATFPASGTIATDLNAIEMSNKKYSGGTASASDKVKLSSNTTSNLDGLAREAASIYYDTDKKVPVFDDGSSILEFGGDGAGRINYLTGDNFDFETGTGDWARYNDGAVADPVDGTGGSPSGNLTISQETTDPLRGSGSFKISKNANSTQGEGVSVDLTIDKADIGKVLEVSFDALTTANYADDDVTVWIYDKDNSTLIQPVPYELKAGTIQGKFKAQFQATYNSTTANANDYRLIFHVASTNATAYDITVDNVIVGPTQYNFGVPSTEWQSYTPTGTFTNTTYTGYWRRLGDSLELQLLCVCTGTPGAATFEISLPSGLSIDTSKIVSSSEDGRQNLGFAMTIDATAAASNQVGNACYDSSGTALRVAMERAGGFLTNTNPFTFAVNDEVKILAKVPIAGWSTNTQFSDDADTRVIAAQYEEASGQTITNGSTDIIQFDDLVDDTHSSVTTGAAWKFTAPSSGRYRVSAMILGSNAAGGWDEGDILILYLYKNGVVFKALDYEEADASPASSTAQSLQGSLYINLDAGDYIDVRLNNGTGVNWVTDTNANWNYISIDKILGPSAIAANELISARYDTDAGQSIDSGSSEIVNFDSTTFGWDSHSSVTTGASWKFTAPSAGKYNISSSIAYNAQSWTAGNILSLRIHKNGTYIAKIDEKEIEANGTYVIGLSGSTLVDMVQGDYIDVRAYQDSGSGKTLNAAEEDNHVSIHKIGF